MLRVATKTAPLFNYVEITFTLTTAEIKEKSEVYSANGFEVKLDCLIYVLYIFNTNYI